MARGQKDSGIAPEDKTTFGIPMSKKQVESISTDLIELQVAVGKLLGKAVYGRAALAFAKANKANPEFIALVKAEVNKG